MLKNRTCQVGLSIVVLTAACSGAQAQLHDGVRTVFLQSSGSNWGAPMNVAYDPNLDLYYTGGGGFPSNSATVNNANGTIAYTTTVPVDLRAWSHNPSTGKIEAVTYNCVNGDGATYGFFSIGRSGGNLDGTKTTILNSMPGLNGDQTMPAFDPAANVLYSGSYASNTVNKVSRTNGSLISTITCSGGPGSNTTYSVGYDADENWLMLFDSAGSRVMVFDGSSGAYIGSAATDVTNTYYGFGYCNKQVWVYDGARNGWQGYDIGAGGGSAYRCSVSGSCPGTVTVAWRNATPNKQQGIVFASNTGSYRVPSGPCQGTTLGLGTRNLQLVNTVSTGSGSGQVNGNAGTSACRGYIQLVTVSNPCKTSNVAQLP